MLLLKKFDFFGAEYKHNIMRQGRQFTSIFGGVFTLVIGLIMLTIIGYKLNFWINGQFSPNIQSYDEINNTITEQINLEIKLEDLNTYFNTQHPVQLNPFQESNVLIVPTITILDFENTVLKEQIALDQVANNSLVIQNFTISTLKEKQKPYTILVQLFKCSSTLLIGTNFSCGSDEEISSFLNNNYLYLQTIFSTNQFNPLRNTFNVIMKSFESYFNAGQTQFQRFTIQTTQYQLISQFESLFSENYVRQTNVHVSQNIIKPLSLQQLNIFVIQLDSTQTIQQIQYLQLSTVLSQIGSLVFIIVCLKQIIIFFNQSNLEDALITEIISYYYPKFKFIKVSKNILGTITSVKCNYQNLSKTEYISFYERAKKIAQQKLSITNQLYELSRLQFIVQSIQSRKSINQSHRIGIPLVIAEEIDNSKVAPLDDLSTFVDHKLENQLSDEDFILLTEFNGNIPKGNNKFYDINQLFSESS